MSRSCYLIVVFFSLALLAACDQAPDTIDEKPLRLVRTLTITPSDNDIWREFSGVVDAFRKAELGFRVSGKLTLLAAKEGDRVENGQLLAQLDDTDYQIQLKSRKAEFDKADADFRRAERLVKTGAISRTDYEQLKVQRETANASVAAAQQNVDYTSLEAPFGGRIAKRHVENFEEVGAKQAIYTLQDPTAFAIKIDVPESVMIRAREGSQPEVYAVFAQVPQRRFALTIDEVSTEADPQTNTFAVSFSMPAVEDLNILPGMSVMVRAKPDTRHQTAQTSVQLPAHAVLQDADGHFVYVVKRQTDNLGIVEKRQVSIGDLSDAGLAIKAGLQMGDEVVTAGMSKMSVGLEVRLTAENSP